MGTIDKIPVKKKKNPIKSIDYHVWMIQCESEIVLEYRAHDTLLGRLWGFPIVQKKSTYDNIKPLHEKYGLDIKGGHVVGYVTHTFTHVKWHITIIHKKINSKVILNDNLHWIDIKNLGTKPIPVAFQKVLNVVFNDKAK